MAVLSLKNLTFTYPSSLTPALDNVNLTVNPGDFIVMCGRSGCGKTTLLRHLKTVLTPHGERHGDILFCGDRLCDVPQGLQAERIGFVLQSAENQIVTDKVWHELAFGMESLGYDRQVMRLRVGEIAGFFGIDSWFDRETRELSGGQKQLLNLAAVMAMQPSLLVLDEPTSQLDPIAASEFLSAVYKINRELGTTVILSEHRLEEAFPMADRAVIMEGGRIVADAPPQEVGKHLRDMPGDIFRSAPAPMRICSMAGEYNGDYPLTVRDGRQWLDSVVKSPITPPARLVKVAEVRDSIWAAIELRECFFKYERNSPDVIKDLSLAVKGGELLAIVGGNGAGKSTVLGMLAGLRRPYRGQVLSNGKSAGKSGRISRDVFLLPQNPQTLFMHRTVAEELNSMESPDMVEEISQLLELDRFMDRHPYDLSGGEQQRLAIAMVLLNKPKILLLDEPTKGIDPAFKEKLADIFKNITARGAAIVMVSHDVEFCARHADRCAMLFNGAIMTENSARAFFAGNNFYTTAANRMARHLFPDAVTDEDVVRAIKGVHDGK